jgi:hypothetical protein
MKFLENFFLKENLILDNSQQSSHNINKINSPSLLTNPIQLPQGLFRLQDGSQVNLNTYSRNIFIFFCRLRQIYHQLILNMLPRMI